MELGKNSKAQLLQKAEQVSAYIDHGFYLHQNAQYEAAVRCYKRGLDLEEGSDRLHCLLGLTYHNLGDHTEAIYHYRKSTELNERNEEAHYYAGFIYIQENRLDEAIFHLETALSINNDMGSAYHYLAVALTRTGQERKALDILKERLSNTPNRPEAEVIFTLGDLLSGRRKKNREQEHAQQCAERLLTEIRRKRLHVFGDSHRSVFNNLEHIKCHNVGAATAYNLISTNSSTGAGNKILKATNSLNPSHDAVLLVFGEIDCMEHIFKNAYKGGQEPEAIIDELVKRYITFTSLLRNRGFTILIYGPAFSGVAMNSYGSLTERNWLVKTLNTKLRTATREQSCTFFTCLDHLLIEENLSPVLSLSEDGRHLDHFPQGSTVIQGAIFSGFIQELQRRSKVHTCSRLSLIEYKDLGSQKPYISIERDRRNGRCFVQTGQDISELVTKAACNTGKELYIVVDMLDHLMVNRVALTLQPVTTNQEIRGEIQLTAIQHKHQHEVLRQAFSTHGEEQISMELEPTVARAVWLRIRFSEVKTTNTNQNLRIRNLQVMGPNHSISNR